MPDQFDQLWLTASKSEVTIPAKDATKARRLRFRLYDHRKALNKNFPKGEITLAANMVVLTITPEGDLRAAPRGSDLGDLLAQATVRPLSQPAVIPGFEEAYDAFRPPEGLDEENDPLMKMSPEERIAYVRAQLGQPGMEQKPAVGSYYKPTGPVGPPPVPTSAEASTSVEAEPTTEDPFKTKFAGEADMIFQAARRKGKTEAEALQAAREEVARLFEEQRRKYGE